MTEKELIEAAFQDVIKRTFGTFHSSIIAAANEQQKTDAEKRFIEGVLIARQVRDRAIAILP